MPHYKPEKLSICRAAVCLRQEPLPGRRAQPLPSMLGLPLHGPPLLLAHCRLWCHSKPCRWWAFR